MKKITTLLLLSAFSLSTFATSNEEIFSDGTVFYHKPNDYVYIETTNPLVSNSLYNRNDLIGYEAVIDTTTNKKVYYFKLKNDNIVALHNKVQTFANLTK